MNLNCSDHSMLIREEVSERPENTRSSPELGSLIGGEGVTCAIISEGTTIHFVVALLRLLYVIGKLHKQIPLKVYYI